MKTTQKVAPLIATLITFKLLAGVANAALTFTFTQDIGGVTMTASGSIDVSRGEYVTEYRQRDALFLFDSRVHTEGVRVNSQDDIAVVEEVRGLDMYTPRLGFGIGSIIGGSGDIGVSSDIISIVSGTDSGLLSVNTSFDATISSSTRVVRFDGVTFEGLRLDSHTTDTDLDLWWATADATEAEKIKFRIVSVPEPSSTILLGFWALGFTIRRRRTNKMPNRVGRGF